MKDKWQKKLTSIDYSKVDGRMRADRTERINFAKKHGYRYYSEMLDKKHKSGISGGQITDFINNGQNEFHVSPGSVEHTLRTLGAFQYTQVRRKQRKKEEIQEKIKSRLSVKNKDYVNNICTCCETKAVALGNRFLCSTCYTNRSQTERFDSGVSIA